MSIKPIETEYRGIRYRSRTEARWAVFFHHAGVQADYEPEAFKFGRHRYLPDFWLPDFSIWFEVKGIGLTKDERRKAEALYRATKKIVLVAVGAPGNNKLNIEIIAPGLVLEDGLNRVFRPDGDHIGLGNSSPDHLELGFKFSCGSTTPLAKIYDPEDWLSCLPEPGFEDCFDAAADERFGVHETRPADWITNKRRRLRDPRRGEW